MTLTLIAAVAANHTIGRDGLLPWRLPADLARFKRRTMGHTLILGRKTFATLKRPLPGRKLIVLTRDPDFAPPGVTVARSLDQALALAPAEDEVFVAGGGDIYHQAIDRADRLDLTWIECGFEGDVFFPAIDPARWQLVDCERHEASDEIPFAFEFRSYDRTG